MTPRNATADKVEQSAYRVPKDHKRHLLAHLIKEGNWHQVLVFTRTKHGANRLTQQLERAGINAMAIHGNKSQNARIKALQDFKDNRITALVATEVAARGLDIKELPHVVNYELPNVPEDYVHRIGRTARAGSTGAAISLVSPDEVGCCATSRRCSSARWNLYRPPKFEIKEGTHTPRAESGAGEYQPHQDPRRRPQQRGPRQGGQHGRQGGRRQGGPQRAPGTATHDAYLAPDTPRNGNSETPHSPGNGGGQHRSHNSQGQRSGGQHSGHKPGGHSAGGQRSDGRSHGHGSKRGGQGSRSGGGFVRGARSSGGRKGGPGSGQTGGQSGGFSRIT